MHTKCSIEGEESFNPNLIWPQSWALKHNSCQRTKTAIHWQVNLYSFALTLLYFLFWSCRWEKHQNEEEAALGRGKRQRKAVSYREAYAPQLGETFNEVLARAFLLQIDFPNVVKSILIVMCKRNYLKYGVQIYIFSFLFDWIRSWCTKFYVCMYKYQYLSKHLMWLWSLLFFL